MKKHSARVAPLSACNSPVLTLTKVEGNGAVPGAVRSAEGPAAATAAAPVPRPAPTRPRAPGSGTLHGRLALGAQW